MVGLLFIAHLLSQPRVKVHVSELSQIADSNYASDRARHRDHDELRNSTDSDAGPVLDKAAKEAYRQRLADPRAELDEARSFNDPVRAEKLSSEVEFITNEITRAVGLLGRDRRSGSQVERTRIRVTNAIRSAIKQINKHNSGLATFLHDTIYTGTYCSYHPSQEAPFEGHRSQRRSDQASRKRVWKPRRLEEAADGTLTVKLEVLGT